MNGRMAWGMLLATVAGAGFGYGVRCLQTDSERSQTSASPEQTAPTHSDSGETLARRYCTGCHLFPEADLLSRQQWLHSIMPAMAVRLGVERPNFDSLQEGRLLEAARIFPSEPQITQEDWFRIWDYYRGAAPIDPLPSNSDSVELEPLEQFEPRRFSFHQGTPTISMLQIEPQSQRLFVGDSYAKVMATVDPAGRVLEKISMPSGPVAMARGRTGWYAALIGRVFPSDLPEGSVIWFSDPLGEGEVKPVLNSLHRPTDVQVGDLTGDGLEDLVVCEFGNQLGRLSWFENQGNQGFKPNVLLDQPGALRAELHDFNGDQRLDILVLMAQAREGLHLFTSTGPGTFQGQPVLERHPLFGYAGLQVLDFDGDGQLDFLTANGDNGDYPTPHKAYHGVRLHLNRGSQEFEEVYFYPMEGAYQAVAADFDEDGDQDIAAISFYPDFEAPAPKSFVFLENTGGLQFRPRTFPEAEDGRWMRLSAGDLDGDGDIDLVLGSFAAGPTTVPVPEEVRARWRESQTAVMVLRNRKR